MPKITNEFVTSIGFKTLSFFNSFTLEYPDLSQSIQKYFDDGFIDSARNSYKIMAEAGFNPKIFIPKVQVEKSSSIFEELKKSYPMKETKSVENESVTGQTNVGHTRKRDDDTDSISNAGSIASVEFLREKPLTLPPMKRRLTDEPRVDNAVLLENTELKRQLEVAKNLASVLEQGNNNLVKENDELFNTFIKELNSLILQKNTAEKKVTSLHNDLTKSIALNNDLRAKNQSLIEKYNGILKFSDRVKSEKNDLIVFMRKMKWF